MKARTITISRQYGSGGHEVAKQLSEALGLPCYDNEVISLAAKESGAQLWEFQMAENLRDTNFIYNLSMIAPHSDIQEEPYSVKLFRAQSEAMAELAERGPAVFVGRCGNFVLRQDPEAVHFFICGSLAKRTERAVAQYGLAERGAQREVDRVDRQRAAYYGVNTSWRWGDGSYYDLVINTDRLGVDGAVATILDYLNQLE